MECNLRRHQTYQDTTLVDNNGTVAGLNKAEQCNQQRALAAARAANDADFCGVGQLEGDAIEGTGKSGCVLEADVFELLIGEIEMTGAAYFILMRH